LRWLRRKNGRSHAHVAAVNYLSVPVKSNSKKIFDVEKKVLAVASSNGGTLRLIASRLMMMLTMKLKVDL